MHDPYPFLRTFWAELLCRAQRNAIFMNMRVALLDSHSHPLSASRSRVPGLRLVPAVCWIVGCLGWLDGLAVWVGWMVGCLGLLDGWLSGLAVWVCWMVGWIVIVGW